MFFINNYLWNKLTLFYMKYHIIKYCKYILFKNIRIPTFIKN